MNSRGKSLFVIALTIFLFSVPARSCGPDFPEAIFVTHTHPGGSYDAFAHGRLGVPQPNYRTRDLVLLYNYLTKRPLSAEEQTQAVAADHHYMDDWVTRQKEEKAAPPNGYGQWMSARNSFGRVDNQPIVDIPNAIGDDYFEDSPNCLDNAFATAARTLAARVQSYGAKSPAVVEWVRGQDAVFTNCGNGKAPSYFGPGTPPPAPPAPHPPAAVASGAPQWLQQDRAYQIAAAHFYHQEFDEALQSFKTIAADTSSPWSVTARYLIARTLIRRSTLSVPPDQTNVAISPKQTDEFRAAKRELLAMQSESRMASFHNASEDLLNYVDLRLQPEKQAAVLAHRLHEPNTRNYKQSIIDLTYLRVDEDGSTRELTPATVGQDSTGMLHWMYVFNTSDEAAALKQWHATSTTVWLLAAISFAKPADPAAPELIRAAASISQSDPAWTALTYHRLRLMPREEATRKELLAITPGIEKLESISTINLFLALNTATAPTLDDWLVTAGRKPQAEADMSGENDIGTDATSIEGTCGEKVIRRNIPLFDIDAAFALNSDFPLTTLATAAESHVLPQNLRYQVAQAAWARAVMLDRPEVARRMSPILIACRAAWKTVLTPYDAATTEIDRKATGLLAMMRFASLEPSVRSGEERRNGFATYDEFRQNWWCSTVPTPQRPSIDFPKDPKSPTELSTVSATVLPPPPLFITTGERETARTELKKLDSIPSAAEYFTTEALMWQKTYPRDPRTPEILGQAFRVERNSCSSDAASARVHQIFTILNTQYPGNHWTQRYKSWE